MLALNKVAVKPIRQRSPPLKVWLYTFAAAACFITLKYLPQNKPPMFRSLGIVNANFG